MLKKDNKFLMKLFGIKGSELNVIVVNPASFINALPVRSPNLDTNVSINTDDLYLSFCLRVL